MVFVKQEVDQDSLLYKRSSPVQDGTGKEYITSLHYWAPSLGEGSVSEDALGVELCPRTERYFVSLVIFPGLRETEHASRTILRHETPVNGYSHVEMSLDMGGDHRARTVSLSDRKENDVRRQVSLLSWRNQEKRGPVGRKALNAIQSLYLLYTGSSWEQEERFLCTLSPGGVCF